MLALQGRPNFPLASRKAHNVNWLEWSCFSRKGFKLQASLRKDQDWIAVNFGIDSRDQKHHFKALLADQREIDREVGTTLRWTPIFDEKSDTKAVLIRRGVNVHHEADWTNQHIWMLDGLERLHNAFGPHVALLPK